MKIFKKLLNSFKIIGIYYGKYIKFVLKYYVKLHLFILNKVLVSNFLYCVYIILMLHGIFGNLGHQEYESYHWMSLFVVCYLQVISIELFIICRIPFAKSFFFDMFGKEFVLINFPKYGEMVFKYIFPYFFLLALEILTIKLRNQYVLYLHDACTVRYEELYGFDGLVWPDMIKQQYHVEQENILSGSFQGLVCGVADDITVLVNFITKSILSFL